MKRTLVLFWHGLGDNILATPAMRQFKKETGDFLGWAMLRRFQTSKLLDACPYIDQLHWIADPWNDFQGIEQGRDYAVKEARGIADMEGYDRLLVVDHLSSSKHKILRTAEEMGVDLGNDLATEVFIDEPSVEPLLKDLDLPEKFVFFHGRTGVSAKDLPRSSVEAWMKERGIALPIISPDFSWDHTRAPIGLAFKVMKRASYICVADSVMYHAAHALGLQIDLAYFQRGEAVWNVVKPLHRHREQVSFRLPSNEGPHACVPPADRERERAAVDREAAPMKVSVCVITNSGLPGQERRRPYLMRLLESVRLAGFPEGATEVIVAGAIGIELPGAQILETPELAASGQLCTMRNRAIERSLGEILILCDDDILFTRGYWEGVEEALPEDWDILCTRILNPNGTRFWDWATKHPKNGQGLLPYDATDPYVFVTGGHGVYRRQVFDALLWNEDLRYGDIECYDFSERARKAGMRFAVAPQATVFLQYQHCDAMSVCLGRPQKSKEAVCPEFSATMSELESGRADVKPPSGEELALLEARLGHKFETESAPLTAEADVSILVACYRYLQRFRIFASSILAQDYDLTRVELVVANPNSPDGLSEHLRTLRNVAASMGGPRIVEAKVEHAHARNRGLLVQRAFEASSGKVVIGMDCDVVLPRMFLKGILKSLKDHPNAMVGVDRRFLSPLTTDRILAGELDPLAEFETLAREDHAEDKGYKGVLGYCQAVPRSAWERVGYPTEFNETAKSDVAFADRLKKHGIAPWFEKDLCVLHLHHPRDWAGTNGFL